MHSNPRWTGAFATAALLLTLTANPAAAATERRSNHCVSPAGIDLNELYDTNDAFATPFCGEGHAGDWWRPHIRWVGAPTHDVTPDGYEPVGETPRLDFLAKLTSARYVVDAGTAREQTFTFDADELVITNGTLPDGSEFVAFTPRLRPMTPGDHTIDLYATMSDDSWDGLGLEEEHHLPAGELLLSSVSLTVRA
jgi:hypothetical protein